MPSGAWAKVLTPKKKDTRVKNKGLMNDFIWICVGKFRTNILKFLHDRSLHKEPKN